jgi:hypothetical protein
MRRVFAFALFVLWLVVGSGSALAQSTEAVLSGTVTDPAGAAIPGAKVVIVNVATGVERDSAANSSGVYVFPALQPGLYQLRAEKTGFRRLVLDDVRLEVGARVQLNLPMRVGDVAEQVEVRADTEGALGYATASVGGMLSGQKVQDLPLPARDALGLVLTQAGMVGDNFAGGRTAALNITLDGLNIQDQRNHQGLGTPVFTSVDRVEELRVVTAPADAEFGRGSGQVQMITRSGTNEFHGSLFEFHRNTALNANTWFNNQRGTDPRTGAAISPRNVLIRNQFGGRVGGPVTIPKLYNGRNKTFFFFLYDAQRIAQRTAVNTTVYTASARQGLVRFFPGVRNGNAESLSPTVDLQGNPRRPANASGDLQTVSLYGIDPVRRGLDPSGLMTRIFGIMPLPNNFRIGDGLNTAGYTWSRGSTDDFDVFNVRLDHNMGPHRLTYSYNAESEWEENGRYQSPYPASPGGRITRRDRFHSLAFLSTLRPTLLNEFRAGVLRPDYYGIAPWQREEFADFFPRANGQMFSPVLSLATDPVVTDDNPVRLFSPLYQFANNLTWIKGKHAFKGGVDVRFPSSNSFNSTDVMPLANFGTGGVPVVGLDRIPGVGQNLTTAINLLNDLSGSLNSVVQALNATGGAKPEYVPGLYKYRHWKRPEVAWYFKDDWKVTPNLTLNLGLRWEYYGVPYDKMGRTAALVGGSSSIFGISGTTFADVYQPGRLNGQLTRVELIGPGTLNGGRKLYGEDFNNFAPAVGVSWNVPWLKRRTVIRAGYGMNYERQSLRLVDVISGDQPGLRERVVFQTAQYLDLRSVNLPLQPVGVPLSLIPLTDRAQTVRSFDNGLRTPYIQNWNFSLQREVMKDMVLDVRYVASKGTKLIRGADINERNIFENGILDAFVTTQRGGNAPLLDRIFLGLNVAGLGVVNGTTITGSDAVRTISTTQAHLAGNNVASFADYLATSTQFTNVRGGLLRRAGLPENFVMVNPQFSSARLAGNYANSTYHSLQVELTKRFSKGWTLQSNYTFSKALGEEDGDGDELNRSYRSGRDRSLDKKLLGFHLAHVFRNSGTFELPLGPGKRFLGGRGGVVARLVERWQFGAIVNVFSGSPISIFSGRASFNSFNAASTPATAVAKIDRKLGQVQRVGNGVIYFQGLQQVADPGVASLTARIRALSTLQGLTDSSGNLLFVNASPGSPGTMGVGFFAGPGSIRVDLNVVKRIQIREKMNFELRADAISATNTPNFDNPNGDMNSVNFGRITGASGNRIMVVGGRFNF